jgi:hypothetical protein
VGRSAHHSLVEFFRTLGAATCRSPIGAQSFPGNLSAGGRIFRRELPPVTIDTDGPQLQFRAYEFEQNDKPLFVFVCIQEDKVAQIAARGFPNEWNARGRLRAVWNGQRNLGQRLLEIAVLGFDDFFRAREAVAKSVREIVQRSDSTTG